jgi:biopolymer transport protein ExbD
MLGLKEGRPGTFTPGGAFSPPAGDVVDITVRFTIETPQGGAGKTHVREVPAWKLLKLSGAEAGLVRPVEWVYCGQQNRAALEAADAEGTLVCLANFATAVLDVPFESTDVNKDLLYEANAEVIPARGTAAEVVLRPTGRRVEPRKVEIEVVLKKDQPPALDGRSLGLEAFREAVHATPAEVRTAVLRADPEERFGRVMEVYDVLKDALMRVTLVVLKEAPPPAAAGPPPRIAVLANDRVRVGNLVLSLFDLKRKAGDLLKGADHAVLVPEKGASWKTVAEAMTILREAGITATVSPEGAPSGGP